MTNKQFLENRLKEYESNMEQARDAGNYPMFVKWEFEVNNVKALIEMNDKSGVEG